MSSFKEILICGLVTTGVAAYCIIDSKQTWISENKQRLQGNTELVCLTQIGDTRYFMETLRVDETETIESVCQRGDRAALLIIDYVKRSDLEKMNYDPTDDEPDFKIISSSEYLDYFMIKKSN